MIWLDGSRICTYIGKGNVAALDTADDGVFFVMNPPDRDSNGTIYRSGELMDMPKGYTAVGNGCVRVINGILHVGLSSLDGRKPILWKDGIVDSLNINGYISAIYHIDSDNLTSPRRECVTDQD